MQYFSGQPIVGFVFVVVAWGFFEGRERVSLFGFGGSGAVK